MIKYSINWYLRKVILFGDEAFNCSYLIVINMSGRCVPHQAPFFAFRVHVSTIYLPNVAGMTLTLELTVAKRRLIQCLIFDMSKHSFSKIVPQNVHLLPNFVKYNCFKYKEGKRRKGGQK